jgi:hypothetical protein
MGLWLRRAVIARRSEGTTVGFHPRLAATTLVLALGAAASLAAQEPRDPHAVQPERPTVATHAGTVSPGWLEIETGFERDRFDPSLTTFSTPTVFKFGLADNAQLSVFGSAQHNPGTTGLGDVGAGVKWRLVDDAPLLGDFAILPSVKFPTGSADRGTGTGTTDVSLLLISSHDLGPVSMDINVGYTHRSGDGSNAPRYATLWTVSFGGPVAGNLGWTGECFGYPRTTRAVGQQPSIVALLGGPTYLIKKWLALDAGVILPLTGPQPHALYAGGVYNVGRM